MIKVLFAWFGALAICSQAWAATNVAATAAANSAGVTKNTPEAEYDKLLEADDLAQQEVDRWIRDNQEFAAKGAALSAAELNRRIRDRFKPVREGYEDFLKRNPNHARAHIAYGSFLSDTGDEEAAKSHWEQALQLDPKNPAIYNNLANVYGHSGPVKKAFEFYAKAIDLNPREPTYYHNFGTVVYLFRPDAKDYFQISEGQVFAKAFNLYSNAMWLDPDNFPLASDVAQTYYGIKPLRTDEALKAWTNAYNIARDDIEREGVQMHFARIKLLSGRFDEARSHLGSVTNAMYRDLKSRLERNLNERETGKTNGAVEELAPAAR